MVSSILRFGAAAVAGALALGLATAWIFARWYCLPRRRSSRVTPRDHGVPFRDVSLRSARASLAAWLLPQPELRLAPSVVVVHGWSGNKGEMLPPATALYREGFNVLLIDARGHGTSDSDGPVTILKFAQDVLAAVAYLRTEVGVRAERIGVLGHSMGGSSVLLAAALDQRIGAVASSSAFADPRALTARFLRALHLPRGPFLWTVCRIIEGWLGRPMDEVTPRLRMAGIRVPVLLLHGADDRFVPASEMDTLFDASDHGRVERVRLPGRRHGDMAAAAQYASRVGQFFTRVLAREERGEDRVAGAAP